MARLRSYYNDKVKPELQKQFGYNNPMQLPRLEKIVLNMGIGDAVTNSKAVDAAAGELSLIAGQKAVVTRAKKSIASFKVREGMALGCKVTLRGDRMYEFLDRFVNIAMPRIRDFRGIPSKSFDGRGNYTLGLKEHIIFPEINYDKVEKVRGIDITFATTANTDAEALALLKAFNMPFLAANSK